MGFSLLLIANSVRTDAGLCVSEALDLHGSSIPVKNLGRVNHAGGHLFIMCYYPPAVRGGSGFRGPVGVSVFSPRFSELILSKRRPATNGGAFISLKEAA